MELYRTNCTSQTGFRNRRNSRRSTQLRFCLEDIGCRVGRLVDPGNPITRSGIVHVVPFFLQSRKTKSSPPRGVLTIRTCLRIRFTTSTPFLFFPLNPFSYLSSSFARCKPPERQEVRKKKGKHVFATCSSQERLKEILKRENDGRRCCRFLDDDSRKKNRSAYVRTWRVPGPALIFDTRK